MINLTLHQEQSTAALRGKEKKKLIFKRNEDDEERTWDSFEDQDSRLEAFCAVAGPFP